MRGGNRFWVGRRFGLEFQEIGGLAIQDPADGFEGAEADSFGSAGFEDGKVLRGDIHGGGEVVESPFSPGKHDIEVDDDGHGGSGWIWVRVRR